MLLDATDAARLVAIASDRSRPLKHIQSARIVLLSAEHWSVQDVARRAGVSRPAVWRWQRRYAEAGVEGDCQEFRVGAAIVDPKEVPDGTTQSTPHP